MKNIKIILLVLVSILLFTDVSLAEEELETSSGITAGNNRAHTMNMFVSLLSKDVILDIFSAIMTIFITFFIARRITSRLERYFEDKGEHDTGPRETYGIIVSTVNIGIWIMGISTALGMLGLDMAIFMGGIGIGVGFALQVFLSNFIAGIIISIQGYHKIGNIVDISGRIGYVIRISSLFSVIEQFDGVRFFVPNVKFLSENVVNFNHNDKRRMEVIAGVDYDTDIVKAKAVIHKVLSSFPNVLENPAPMIWVEEFGNNSIQLKILFWFNSKENVFTARSNVVETLNLAFKQAGIIIAFPQVTLSHREDILKNVGK